MDADLIQVARTLAERGWLPGIEWSDSFHSLISGSSPNMVTLATEADLHLAAHNEIVRRGWTYEMGIQGTIIDTGNTWGNTNAPGTTTLSLLRALRRACEEHERNEGAKR